MIHPSEFFTKEFEELFKIRALEKFSQIVNEENRIFPHKNHDISERDFLTSKKNDEEIKHSKNQPIGCNKAYIGDGNNSLIVKSIFKTRSWWTIKDKLKVKDCNFIWTQWLKTKVI